MKKLLLLAIVPVFAVLFLTGCGWQQPLTEAQQAESYWLTLEEFREEKQAAARMNMTIEEHMRMLESWEEMDMWDDSMWMWNNDSDM